MRQKIKMAQPNQEIYEAWWNVLGTNENALELDFEFCFGIFLKLFYNHNKRCAASAGVGHGPILTLDSGSYVGGRHIDIVLFVPINSYSTRSVWNEAASFISEETSNLDFRMMRNAAVIAVAAPFIVDYIGSSITPEMFRIFCEHAHADMAGNVANNKLLEFSEEIAHYWHLSGAVYGRSTGIHEMPTYGYGCIDFNGFWLFEIPTSLVEKKADA